VEDIKAYIESGILELYVMGDLTPDERRQVEAMASAHPVVKAELAEIERSMEAYALENAIEPNEALRSRILNSLVTNLGDDRIFDKQPADNAGADNVIAINAKKPVNGYKYAFAACLALLIASVAVLANVYNKLQDANTQLIAANAQNQHIASTVKYMDNELGIYRNPAYKVIKLNGMPKHATASMLVAYNATKKQVMIDMAGMQLPANDQAHQYQLWAIVDKKPVSLGVFDKNTADSANMKEMQSVTAPQAFAVTLEPRGGSVNPTMDQMMVIGNY
jgi:anti-sigma-K factor RskA